MAVLVAVLVFLAGYATQRGSVCAVRATCELVFERKASRHVGFLFCAACGLAMLVLGHAGDWPVFRTYSGLPATGAAVAGGAIVGLGAFLNGRCAFGTVAELGSGRVWRLATLAGFMAGTVLGDRTDMSVFEPASVPSPLATVPTAGLVAMVLAIVAVLGVVLWRLQRPHAPPEWSPLRAMAVIGLGNGVLLVLARSWPYTSVLMHVARGDQSDLVRGAQMASVFVAGAVAGGMLRGFRLHVGAARDWLQAFAGGTVMGIGAVLVPGGNDVMLLVGIPLLLPNLVIAYFAMSLVLCILFVLRLQAMRRMQTRPPGFA